MAAAPTRTKKEKVKVKVVHPNPDVVKGVEYWQGVPATVDGVLGGFGKGTLPRVDALGSRTFLAQVLPRLSAVAPSSAPEGAEAWLKSRIEERGGEGRARTRALDCGAGIGRVTRDALSKLVDVVHLVEPVENFLAEAKKQSATWPSLTTPPSLSPFRARKAAHFHLSTLQAFDPSLPYSSSESGPRSPSLAKRKRTQEDKVEEAPGSAPFEPTLSPRDQARGTTTNTTTTEKNNGEEEPGETEALSKQEPTKFDVIWCQWCLQHLSDRDLVSFLRKAQGALVGPTTAYKRDQGAVLDGSGIIVVKENVVREHDDGEENVWYDEEDKSITRSINAYERVFAEAGLVLVRKETQLGLPEELFPVIMWCLRAPENSSKSQ